MQFILTAGWEDGIADLTQRLAKELAAGKRVLWLVSGGSNVQASVEVMDNISADLSKNLSAMVADERYGAPGHDNSNEAQLLKAGFDLKNGTLISVLQPGMSLEETVIHYNELAEKAFADNDIVIAQLGIGPDGHVAGIMINSPEVVDASALVVSIPSTPWDRLTLSFAGLRHITADYSFAFGEPKKTTLQQLESESTPLDQQPAQILKELPEAYIYSDQIVEHA